MENFRKREVLASAIGFFVLGSVLLTAMPTHAAENIPSNADALSVRSVSEDEQRAALEYWTPERVQQSEAYSGGETAEEQADADAQGTEGDVSASDRVDPAGGTEMMSTGRLFFVRDGKNSFCTANAVQSATKSVVATAAHCVEVPRNKPSARIEHIVFLAHYRNGEWAGRFPVRNIFTVSGWAQSGEDGFDFAFLSLAANNYGSRVGDLVIPSGVRFTQNPTMGNFYLYGYPNSISGGELPQKCSGRAIENPYAAPGPELRLVRNCLNFSGGASGGPAMQTLADGTYQTGNVKGYFNNGGVTFTYWEAAAHGAWDRAQHDQ